MEPKSWIVGLTVSASVFFSGPVFCRDTAESILAPLDQLPPGERQARLVKGVWFGAVLQYLGKEAGLRFMKKLNEQNPRHYRGRRLRTQLVAAGESDLARGRNP